MRIEPRDAFWVWNPEVSVHHIHIVLTYPEHRAESRTIVVAVVNVTSIRAGVAYDRTTTLDTPDYPEKITHPSYVWYQRAHFKSVQELEDETKSSVPGKPFTYASRIPAISEATFEKICDGVQESDYTPDDVRDYCFERHPGDGTVTRGSDEATR